MGTKPTFEPLLINVNQVAQLLGCHPNTVWNRVRSGELPEPRKFGNKSVWLRAEIEKIAQSLFA